MLGQHRKRLTGIEPAMGCGVVLPMLDEWRRFRRGALKCAYSNHTASYESLLNKAPLPSLEAGRQMSIAIQTFKILNDLAPTYLLELIEKRSRTRNLRNSENILKISPMKRVRNGTNSFCFLTPKNLELFARGIENYQRPKNFQRWRASLFFSLVESIIAVGPLAK